MALSITGLSGSGLNVTELVKGLMDAERVPYKNLQLRREKMELEQQVFRQINTKLNTLNNAVSDLKYAFNLQAFKATSSSNAITATASETAMAGTYQIEVTKVAVNGKMTATSDKFLEAVKASENALVLGSGEDAIDFNDANLRAQLGIDDSTDDEELLKKVVNYINANSSKAESTISMIKVDGKYQMDFTSKDTSTVSVSNLAGASHVAGQDAEFTVNGTSFTSNSNKIEDIIPGVSFTIGSSVELNTPIELTVATDTDKIAAKVQKFVDAYNDLIKNVRTNLAKPENVEETMNPLQGDSVLKDINARLYDIFNQSTLYGFMEDIGLSIDKGAQKASSMTGEITFDKEAFKKALEENPSKTISLITDVSEDMSDTISKNWTSTVSGVMSVKIAGYDADLKRTDERLEAMDRSLQMKEARYKQQFDAMEIMLASLSNTQKWLTSQFDSMTKNNKS